MKVSAVVCTYKRYDLLPKSIESALDQSLDHDDYNVIVVDNSPANEEGARNAERYRDDPRVTYHIEDTPGLSNARNVGAGLSSAEIIAYIDDDAIADHDWLASLVGAFDAFPEAGAVGGRINPIWEEPRPPWLSDRMLGMLTVVNWGGVTRLAEPHEWVAGANVAFRRQPLLEIGGFDTSLGRTGGGAVLLSNEESAVIDRLKQAGRPLVYCPTAQVDHLVEAKRVNRKWIRARTAWQAISDYIKNGGLDDAAEDHRWREVAHHFNEIPLYERTPRGFFTATEDQDEFERQIRAIYGMISLMMAGRDDVEQV